MAKMTTIIILAARGTHSLQGMPVEDGEGDRRGPLCSKQIIDQVQRGTKKRYRENEKGVMVHAYKLSGQLVSAKQRYNALPMGSYQTSYCCLLMLS